MAGYVAQNYYYEDDDQEKRHEQLEFTEQVEKLLEIVTILLLGTLLLVEPITQYLGSGLLVAGLLIFVIRPVGVWISMLGSRLHSLTRWLFGWFGVRGVGSLYYLTYALGEGIKGDIAEQIVWITYITVVISVVAHGITATPLMSWYQQKISSSSPSH